MTLRRVLVLIKALPNDSAFWRSVRAAEKKAEIPTGDRIRDRQAHYRNQARAWATAKRKDVT